MDRCGGGVANSAKRSIMCLLLTSRDAQRSVEGDVSGFGNPVEWVSLIFHDELLRGHRKCLRCDWYAG